MEENLRALIEKSADIFDLCLAGLVHAGDAEVADLDRVVLALQEDVARLQISVDDVLRMKVVDGQQDLKYKTLDARFREQEAVLVLQVGLEIATVAVLGEDAQQLLVRVVKVVLLPANVWMPEALHHRALVQLVAQIAGIRVDNRDLLHDEDLSIKFVSDFVGGTISSLAEAVQDLEVCERSRLLWLPGVLVPRLAVLLLEQVLGGQHC